MKNYTLFLIAFLFLGLFSCQKEETTETVAAESLTKTSALSTLVSRVAQYPTTKDNILDGTDCFAVLLPVTVTVDGVTLTVSSDDNCENVQSIINAHSDDDDVIHFTFPIRIKYKNFQEVQVNSQQQYESILATCPPNGVFREIECIDFSFPIVINAYNTVTQTPTTITVSNNMQLYNFIDGLTSNEIYTIVYPLSMTKSGGQVVVFNSNAALQAGIENSIDDCQQTGPTPSALSVVLANGTWFVSSYIDENHDETYKFNGYNFTFSSNGAVVAVKNHHHG